MTGYSITISVNAVERDELIAELWDAGTTGITEEDAWIRAFFESTTTARDILHRFAFYHPHYEQDEPQDWVAHAHSQWESFPVGERFYLVPEWLDDPAPCGRVRLRIRPGMACGSGSHPGTQLCLQALERTVSDGLSVLDVGTGSGILAEAAELLGARPVVACDIDHEATMVARRNLAQSPVAPALFTGSLRSVRDASVDIVVANLNGMTIAKLAADMLRVARSTIIVSGFRDDESTQVVAQFGSPVRDQLELDDWACLIIQREFQQLTTSGSR